MLKHDTFHKGPAMRGFDIFGCFLEKKTTRLDGRLRYHDAHVTSL